MTDPIDLFLLSIVVLCSLSMLAAVIYPTRIGRAIVLGMIGAIVLGVPYSMVDLRAARPWKEGQRLDRDVAIALELERRGALCEPYLSALAELRQHGFAPPPLSQTPLSQAAASAATTLTFAKAVAAFRGQAHQGFFSSVSRNAVDEVQRFAGGVLTWPVRIYDAATGSDNVRATQEVIVANTQALNPAASGAGHFIGRAFFIWASFLLFTIWGWISSPYRVPTVKPESVPANVGRGQRLPPAVRG